MLLADKVSLDTPLRSAIKNLSGFPGRCRCWQRRRLRRSDQQRGVSSRPGEIRCSTHRTIYALLPWSRLLCRKTRIIKERPTAQLSRPNSIASTASMVTHTLRAVPNHTSMFSRPPLRLIVELHVVRLRHHLQLSDDCRSRDHCPLQFFSFKFALIPTLCWVDASLLHVPFSLDSLFA